MSDTMSDLPTDDSTQPPTDDGTQPPASDSTQSPTNHSARRVLAGMMVVLLIILGISTYNVYRAAVPKTTMASKMPTDTKGIVWVRSIYGTSNRAVDLFRQPQSAVSGEGGIIWVADTGKTSSLTRFNPDGTYASEFKSVSTTSPISSPSRTAIGPDGRIYICETTRDRIHVLAPNGEEAGSFSVPQPVSIAISEDRIAVGSVSGFAVLDKTGRPMGVKGSRGKGDDQFDYVHGIAFGPDGSVYVADSYNNRLSAYESDGTRRWIIRTGAPANGAELTNNMLTSKEPSESVLKGADALQLPLGLTIDGAGRIVVADMFDCTLAVFETDTGKFVGKYGDVGAEDGQFFYPVSVGYDSSRDWFTVADAMNRRVQIVRIPGSGSTTGRVMALANRAQAGPWRACVPPLLLVILAIITYVTVRAISRRRGVQEEVDLALSDAAEG